MARYLVQSQHTAEECLKGLDDFLATGPGLLAQFDFACAAGDHMNHVAYATLEGASESVVRQSLPADVRTKATITEVGKVTPEMVKAFHQ